MTSGVCGELRRTEHENTTLPQILLNTIANRVEVIAGVCQKYGRLRGSLGPVLACRHARNTLHRTFCQRRSFCLPHFFGPEFANQPTELAAKTPDHIVKLRILMRFRDRITERAMPARLLFPE